ncbi:Peptidoglycan/LPS O-acetylase OafA/YrhL, contains acyltransferase and SGNH-hydrolase domains [Granulicella pectinivorans]|uniref:Peptidoglycan/LPS O-acetylase OafA/YrhL, contains acyltransferase and SGNH-hydrolase domains n=1 Tax=Granulicella pectinivorans TaxID=474950 RepID=A0A1I6MYE1_9BACT|nr:acyltransferase [Granulicella pectinivorans]SFS20713.1 Peptidoglycan/LPS O-acetylase OafA/YrhL, contains acyltransferase and SGNH-hydrolase domains [Granulicella pectinivorans]
MPLPDTRVESTISHPTAKSLLRPYYPAFDGLRGLAILVVCLAHYLNIAWPQIYPVLFWGSSAIDLFFVLSGFLITGVLFDALPYARFFRTFYTRRALRLLPPFLFVWAILLLIALFLHPVWSLYNFSFLVCLGNLFTPAGIAGYHADPSFFCYVSASGHRFYATISHMWTLSQEEQFYLVWPFALFFIRDRRLLIRLCLIGAVLTLGLRVFLLFHADPRLLAADLLYYNPFTRFDSHLIGAALALIVRGETFRRLALPRLRAISRSLFFTPIMTIALLEFFVGRRWPLSHHHPLFTTVGFTFDCIATTGLMLMCIDPRAIATRIFSHPGFTGIGRISYSFYLFHYLPMQFFVNQHDLLARHHLLIAIPVIALGATYLTATLSYLYLERPVRSLSTRLAPNPASLKRPA